MSIEYFILFVLTIESKYKYCKDINRINDTSQQEINLALKNVQFTLKCELFTFNLN